MNSDKELADAVVALGVGCTDGKFYDRTIWDGQANRERLCHQFPAQFVTEWRVAGALMEKFGSNHDLLMKVFIKALAKAWSVPHQPLPRAINEACVEALTACNKGDDRE